MKDKRCQSCGMRFEVEGFHGTNTDGSENREYCRFCFEKGSFTKPDLTLREMIQASVDHMSKKLNFTEEKARELSEKVIPELKRWKSH
ncbi:hypothetical protein A3G67_02605 [Candidatus Roizmanbacteria bacterium RIFCSPLOWO2_12_FULL_40_12]|nr:MAG: hypothetical protein A3G67_02605 [Candidatus Roizmanbacteria bacterium RIFCSPLOWO2_12_FULL_40_12]